MATDVVETGGVPLVGPESATLEGVLNSLEGESSLDVYFEWGTSDAYGNTTPAQEVYSTGTFSADISGLTPDTTYHFRAVATDGNTWTGEDQTFDNGPEASGAFIQVQKLGGVLFRVRFSMPLSNKNTLRGGKLLDKSGVLEGLLGNDNKLPKSMTGFWPQGCFVGEAEMKTDDDGVVFRLIETDEIEAE